MAGFFYVKDLSRGAAKTQREEQGVKKLNTDDQEILC
jgi:hypothetical protein